MNTKVFLIAFLSALGLAIIGSIAGSILESSGRLSAATLGHKGTNSVLFVFFVLFCVMCFSIVPLAVRFFIYMQIKIGNGQISLVKLFAAHEREIVYGSWLMICVGFGIIFLLGKDDILRSLK